MTALVCVFEREEDLLNATAAARRGGLEIVDVFAPYAVHGLDQIIDARPTRLPWVCFILGLAGAVTAILFQQWSTAVSWPINIGGKPWNSVPAFVPVAFEVMVLGAGMGTVAAFFWAAGLWPGRRPVVLFPRVTDDRFALVVRATAATSDRTAVKDLFAACHAATIDEREI